MELISSKKYSYLTTVRQHKGKRETQQDTAGYKACRKNGNVSYLLAVADGVGSTDRGGSASAFVVQSLMQWFDKARDTIFTRTMDEIVSELVSEIEDIDLILRERSKDDGHRYGTALSLVITVNSRCVVIQIGDARVYLYDGATFTQIERDQTKYELYMERGLEIPKEKETEFKACITQCIGLGKKPKPKATSRVLSDEYSLLICTDGFYSKLTEEELKKLLSKGKLDLSAVGEMALGEVGQLDELALENYIATVLSRGGTDNVTAMIHRRM